MRWKLYNSQNTYVSGIFLTFSSFCENVWLTCNVLVRGKIFEIKTCNNTLLSIYFCWTKTINFYCMYILIYLLNRVNDDKPCFVKKCGFLALEVIFFKKKLNISQTPYFVTINKLIPTFWTPLTTKIYFQFYFEKKCG